MKKGQGQGIKGRQHQSKKPMAQRRVAPPHSSSESSEGEEGAEEEEGDNQVGTLHVVLPQQSGPQQSGPQQSDGAAVTFDKNYYITAQAIHPQTCKLAIYDI